MTTKIVWNGCDAYVEADEAVRRGYDFDGEKLYKGSVWYAAFEATEIDTASLPRDEDGGFVVDGVLGSESGKFYKNDLADAPDDIRFEPSPN